ncbi:MAG TPA: lamin tail domain-containing protein, partial [Bacteroidales bacterium]|nr:lamin tail domain-containing protein [Bacteroidales bacterium]
ADSLEFIELYNNSTQVANLQDFTFSEGVEFTFPSYDMAPHSYLVIAKNSAAMQNTFGTASLQWTSGSLSNSGELIRIKDYNGFTVDSVVYNDVLPWDTLANGFGPSLEFCDPDSNNALPENWRHAVEFAAMNSAGDSIWASPGTGCKYPPVADFSADYTAISIGGSVNFTDLSTGIITSWEWSFEGGNPATSLVQTPPAIAYNAMGTYGVSLKVINPDGISLKSRPGYILVGPSGIEVLDPQKTVVIYPNPTSGKFSVIYQKQEFTARVLSVTGNYLTEKQSVNGTAGFDLSTYQNGIYFIQIADNQSNLIVTKKVIIQK